MEICWQHNTIAISKATLLLNCHAIDIPGSLIQACCLVDETCWLSLLWRRWVEGTKKQNLICVTLYLLNNFTNSMHCRILSAKKHPTPNKQTPAIQIVVQSIECCSHHHFQWIHRKRNQTLAKKICIHPKLHPTLFMSWKLVFELV